MSGAQPHPLVDEVESILQYRLEQRLEDYPGWPMREFKLSAEQLDLYQTTTGTAIDRHDDIVRKEVPTDNSPQAKFYAYDHTPKSEIRDSEAFSRKEQFDDFLSNAGNFANLVVYVVSCQVKNEINIDAMEVRPEDYFRTLLYHTSRVPDVLISLEQEHAPVEVYNGGDYVNDRNDKHDQLMDLKSPDDEDVNSNPIFVNRRSTDDFKKDRLKDNITVVDTDQVICSGPLYEEYQDAINFFDLESLVTVLPLIECTNGESIAGDDYDVQENGSEFDDVDERQDALHPPEDMVSDFDTIKNETEKNFVKRVRGGIQLHYVSSIYRRSSGSAQNAASIIIQNMYHNLLRADSGVPKPDAIAKAREDALEEQGWIEQVDDGDVRQEIEDIIEELKIKKVLTLSQGNLTPRRAVHPQPSFSYRD